MFGRLTCLPLHQSQVALCVETAYYQAIVKLDLRLPQAQNTDALTAFALLSNVLLLSSAAVGVAS
jgi:hypothetical protein